MASKTFLFTSTIEFIHCMYVHDIDLLINTSIPATLVTEISGMVHSQKMEGNITPNI